MNNKSSTKIFVGDFETTVFDGQEYTEVWCSACVELFSDDVKIFHSIKEQFEYFKSLDCNIICYYHNLKFDGNFWLSYLMNNTEYQLAASYNKDDITTFKWSKNYDMPFKSYKYLISSAGLWYSMRIQINKHYIEFRDSYKLLPFSVDRIGKSFETKHKKLSMEYTGFRYAGCTITDEEIEYIKNDVLVIKEAMEIMMEKGHKKITIGSCCFDEYKSIIGAKTFQKQFPQLYNIDLDSDIYNADCAGDYIRQSYRGGWCYLVEKFANKVIKNGVTYDVNSLYPSVMHSESGNKYPIGKPEFWHGNYIPTEANDGNHYYFIRIKTRFYLRKGKLPFIQIKNNILYRGTEMLKTSDVKNKKGEYSRYYYDLDGEKKDSYVIMTMTMTDFELFLQHYIVEDFEILDGCYFQARRGIFDDYIDKYKEIKLTSTGAVKQLAKLFLNNLYGKMATNTDSSFKVGYEKSGGEVGFFTVPEHDKEGGYIAIGSAITSYARCFTITAAQKNYQPDTDNGFIYADTDSIHCRINPDDVKGVKIDDKDFCCWKCESVWKEAIFVRQKTYIEVIQDKDELIYDVKCAGMPKKCKDLFINSITQDYDIDKYNEEEKEFLQTKRELTDFKIGLCVPSKLLPKSIRGGIVLLPTTFEMR